MHELAVCQALISQVEAIARQHQATEVTNIILRLGPLSGVVGELLQRAYPLASAGSIANKAELIIEHSAIRVHCNQCSAETDVTASRLICGECGDWRTQIISGDELLLTHVEMEKFEIDKAKLPDKNAFH